MRATGTADRALWLTETGWNTADMSEEAQASYVEQVLAGAEAEAWRERVFFSQFVDEPDSPDAWGVLRMDLRPKPAYDAYRVHIAANAPALP
jgi:hypothetical protein